MKALLFLFPLLVAASGPPPLQDALAALQAGRAGQAQAMLQPYADRGSPIAETLLADLYAKGGAGLDRDPAIAVSYLLRAAERGYPPAQLALAGMLARGEGVGADRDAAYRWSRIAQKHSDGALRDRAIALADRLSPGIKPKRRHRLDEQVAGWRPRPNAWH